MSDDSNKQLFKILVKQKFKCAGIPNYPECACAAGQFDESGCEIVDDRAICTECYKIHTERPIVRNRLLEFITSNSGKTYNSLESLIGEFTEWEKKKFLSNLEVVKEVAQTMIRKA
jgi:hypothetical protein